MLAEFGRAYGQLPDDLQALEPPQEAFLQKAIRVVGPGGPHRAGAVGPVRGDGQRPTVVARDAAGLGWSRRRGRRVPRGDVQRADGESARIACTGSRTLGARRLLPARGTEIRGRVSSNTELLDISGYGRQPRAFKELMRILDSETRLLTPMDLEALDVQDLSATPGSHYYQLTHDYLVPSLRQWLTEKQRSTRSGRVELRLEERSRLWNASPERRQLPSLLEWISIRLVDPPVAVDARAETRHAARPGATTCDHWWPSSAAARGPAGGIRGFGVCSAMCGSACAPAARWSQWPWAGTIPCGRCCGTAAIPPPGRP